MGAVRTRRLALTAVAAGVIAAGALASHGPEAPHTHRARKAAPDVAALPHGGEPQPPQSSTAPRAAQTAAVRFVRDYAGWEAGELATLPPHDAAERVIELLEHAGRHGLGAIHDVTRSVHIGLVGADRYAAISAVGNFLLGRRGSRWLVVSVPGD